ncbi:transmembrane protein, putative (macronuclear) [Tetrahymena thermophila SB210]|uniref:Transmembrane protein, putative n=1 Tax=Tetrahymena thermophila (strain SB210) TaxID=312017 RepID=I7MM10_TETTS|nr:transmembrane protein, putative [Tetrahymena thermophila SB210]EAS03758.1 transmembrane protein, putative [Tetrahymena thermophila SB210]|eukprot:XP_001024003.1 transmembrane protein, putative [Tetrahymena thermophila SB210]
MSFLQVDENQIPSFMNESKKRQSCPAQISELSHRSFGKSSQILGDTTNMRRSFVESTSKSSFLSEKKLSASSHLSEREQAKSEIRFSNKNDKLEESQLKKSSLSKQDYSIIEEDSLSQRSGILSKESSVSKRLSTSSIKEELNASSQKSEQASNEQISKTSFLPQNKQSSSPLKKIILFVFICFVCFLAVASAKIFIFKVQGQTNSLNNSEEIFVKNKYFGELTSEKQPTELQNQMQIQQNGKDEIQEVVGEEAQEQTQIDLELKQQNVYNTKYSDQNISQLSMSKQEMLIQEESQLFFNNLVKVVQTERRIPYQQFEEYLLDRCTPAIFDKVKERIQILVDESVSIKEELDISNGSRFYVSLEKN